MEKLISKMQKFLIPLSNKLSGNRYLNALSNCFQMIMPVIIIGSFACLFAFIDIPVWQNFIKGNGLDVIFMTVQSLTLSCLSLYTILALPYCLAKNLDLQQPFTYSIMSLVAFLLVTPTELYQSIPTEWLGHPGLFTAIVVGFLVPTFVKFLLDHDVRIKMPKSVPPIVSQAFETLVPFILVVVIAMALSTAFAHTSYGSVHNAIYTIIQMPLKNIGLTLPAYLFIQIMTTLFMYCGIHGSTILNLIQPLTLAASAENLAALQAGTPNAELPNIITSSFALFIQPGGIGASLCIAALCAFAAKSQKLKSIGKISFVPSLFNISEPVLFGLPCLLNPIAFIPFMLCPIWNTITSYLAIKLGFVAHLTGVDPSWTVPQLLSGFLSGGWSCALLQLINIIVNFVIWYPFFKILDNQALEEEKKIAE